jgi:hydroxypyruvate reductase
VLEKYDLMARFPESVREFFLSSRFVESPKPGEVEARVYALLSSEDLAAEARKAAEQRGFAVAVDNTCDDWEYEAAAEYLLGRVRELRVERARVCLISAGEVTVRLPAGGSGQGGRNQHLALYSAIRLGDGEAVMSAGSDGIDGNSPAAGAAVDRGTVAGREDEGLRALDEFSSYGFLRDAGAVIMTGPSGNNLRDLRVLLAE